MALNSLAARVKTDPALLARVLRNPGLRSKLPDQYLTPQQRAARQHNQFLSDIGNGQPLAGPSMVNAAQQITNSDFAPLLADVGQREKVVNASAGLQGDWAKRYYGNLDQLLGAIGAQQATANQNAQNGANVAIMAAKNSIAQADQGAQDRAAQDAAVRGAGLEGDFAANQAARTANAQQQEALRAQQQQQSVQNFGNTQDAFLRGLQGATAQAGGEYQQKITGAQNQALNSLAQDRSNLEAKKAGTFTDTLLKLRNTEAQNAITQAGLGIRQNQAAASATNAAGAEGRKYGYTPSEWAGMTAAQRTQIVAANKPKKAPTGYGPGGPGMNKYGYTYGEWQALSTAQKDKARAGKGAGGAAGKPASGPGSLSSSEEAKRVGQVNKVYQALSDPSSFQIATVVNGQATYRPAKNAQEVLKALKGKMVDPRVLNVARSLLHNGGTGLGQFGVKNAHDLGVHVNPHWKVVRTPDTSMTANGPGR